MKRFCPTCLSEEETESVEKLETITVRGEPVEVESTVARCKTCGIEILDITTDDEVLKRAYDLYRRSHGLLFPNEIKGIREMYGLSHRAMQRLLGWGLVTTQRYEQGALQDEAHDSTLKQMRDNPVFVYEQFEKHRAQFSEPEQARLGTELLDRCLGLRVESLASAYENWEVLEYKKHPIERGCRAFDFWRTAEVVLTLASKVPDLYQTKLAKLMWVSDFARFRMCGQSMTGLAYARLPYGPAPHRFRAMLELMEELAIISLVQADTGELIRVRQAARPAHALMPDELELLERVVARYGHLSCKKLSKMSHQEPVWAGGAEGSMMSYADAGSVSMVREL